MALVITPKLIFSTREELAALGNKVVFSSVLNTMRQFTFLPSTIGNGSDQFLITLKDGDHMVFSGGGRMRGSEKDKLFQSYIRASSPAFWDAN